MKDRPILLSPEMVQATLEGRKTQTRRVIKPQPDAIILGEPCWNIGGYRARIHRGVSSPRRTENLHPLICPYGQPGDRLWVKEGHYLHGIWDHKMDSDGKSQCSFKLNRDMGVQFIEPNVTITGRSTTIPGWHKRNSLFMPRWASRVTLEVKEVRVERLQYISEMDALAEGTPGGHGAIPGDGYNATPYEQYRWLWEQIHDPGSWDANPWVWVITFDILQQTHDHDGTS